MTAKEIKSEIQKVLDTVPENILPDVLDYLRLLQNQKETGAELSIHMRQILAEDKALLQKLAQ